MAGFDFIVWGWGQVMWLLKRKGMKKSNDY
jgi:hypothetical protein